MKQRQAARLRRQTPARLAPELAARLKAMSADQSGLAAIELGIFAPLLFLALVNVVDVTIYLYQRMQVQNATQVAVQAAWKACDLPQLPATVNCPGLTTAIQNALASTSLGTSVSLVSGSPSEGYYCVNSSNALQYIRLFHPNHSIARLPGRQACSQVIIFRCNRHLPMRRYFPASASAALSRPRSTVHRS